MLYDGTLKALALAREGFAQPVEDPRRIETINANLLKAQAILGDLQDGPEPRGRRRIRPATLQRLYDYHNRRLLEANLRSRRRR